MLFCVIIKRLEYVLIYRCNHNNIIIQVNLYKHSLDTLIQIKNSYIIKIKSKTYLTLKYSKGN